jgi:hypothetical protein
MKINVTYNYLNMILKYIDFNFKIYMKAIDKKTCKNLYYQKLHLHLNWANNKII